MPTTCTNHPCDIDPRRWSACMRQAEAAMLADGWSRHAGKFHEVRMRRARKLWAQR